MATVFDALAVNRAGAPWLRWLPVAAALLVLYVPTYYTLAHGAWNEEHNAHGPLVLVVIAWLVWRERAALAALPERGATIAGSVSLAIGLVFYVLGRALEFVYFEAFSQIPVFAGVLLFIYGWRGVRLMWFPLLYLMFLVPLPGVVVDAATGSLKQLVSVIAENALYHAGYPIARTGVILSIGQYQLLVADACSGLNSMYSLTAMGLLFLYVTWDGNWLRAALMLLAIWPIAFAANVVRVITLVLITYYLGDEAAQGFLHGFSGIMLFLVALFLLFGLHTLLGVLTRRRSPAA
ncbi:MAG: exosortase B [Rhodospirillaceae bacterium]